MVNIYGKDGKVYDNYKAIEKAFKSGGVSVGINDMRNIEPINDVLYGMVKIDKGGFVFSDGDGVGAGQLSDDAFAGRYNLKNKMIIIISDKGWSDSDLSKFKKLCANANRFGCMIIVNSNEYNRLGGVVDFTIGGDGNIVVEDVSSNSNKLLGGVSSSNRLGAARKSGSLLDRYRNG